MTDKIPEIDIYNRHYWNDPIWKKYFNSDSIDAELDHPNFNEREMMRRLIAQTAIIQYNTDLEKFISTDWINDEMPGGISNDEWNRLQMGYETVKALFTHFHRVYKDEE